MLISPRGKAAWADPVPNDPPPSDLHTGCPSLSSGVDRGHLNQPTDGAAVLEGGWRDPPGGGGGGSAPLAVAHTNSFNVTYLSLLY